MPLTRTRLVETTIAVDLSFTCEVCSRPLEPTTFSDGGHWSIRGLAMRGRRRFKSTLCFDCYMKARRAAVGAGGALRGDGGA